MDLTTESRYSHAVTTPPAKHPSSSWMDGNWCHSCELPLKALEGSAAVAAAVAGASRPREPAAPATAGETPALLAKMSL